MWVRLPPVPPKASYGDGPFMRDIWGSSPVQRSIRWSGPTIMKIKLDKYGCCQSETCLYRKSCAQHKSAGDFRSEDGFRPEFSETECKTADVEPMDDFRYEVLPKNYNSLDRGFLSLQSLKSMSDSYQI